LSQHLASIPARGLPLALQVRDGGRSVEMTNKGKEPWSVPMPFSIVALQSGTTRISLEGDLDVFTLEGLRPELLDVARRRPTHVEMELSRLRSINQKGMQLLVSFLGNVARVGSRITVLGLRDQPLESFRTALLDAILDASQPPN
jgi:anti-anti-sigma regulatory factor